MKPIEEAVEKAGGAIKLARKLGITHQAIYLWVRRGYAPIDRAERLEKMTNIPRHRLVNPRLVRAIIATEKIDAADLL